MTEQELDLLEIPSGLSAELGAGPAEIMSAAPFDADPFGGLLDH